LVDRFDNFERLWLRRSKRRSFSLARLRRMRIILIQDVGGAALRWARWNGMISGLGRAMQLVIVRALAD